MYFTKVFVVSLFLGIASHLYAQDKPTIQRAPAKFTDPSSGVEMYTSYCAACHGATGKGNGPAAVALKKQPADLTQLAKKNGGKFPDLSVSNTIRGSDVAAHGSRDMPIWGQIFTDMQDARMATLRIHNLTDYVRSLQAK
jgi:mono/diheme cytochrome c family protein